MSNRYVKKPVKPYTVNREYSILKTERIDYMADYVNRRSQQHMQQRQMPRNESCGMQLITPLPANFTVAMMYVPMQTDTSMFDEMKALECGTLFPVLNKPFAGKCCK